MHAIIWISFALADWIGLFVLTLALFRFRFKDQIPFILWGSLCFSIGSYLIRIEWNLAFYAPSLQFILVILFFRFFNRCTFIYSALIVAFGYLGHLFLQTILLFLIDLLLDFSMNDTNIPEHVLLLMTILSFILNLFIAFIIDRYRIGFTFNLTNSDFLSSTRWLTLIAASWCLISLFLILYEYHWIQYITVIITIVLGVMMHLMLKKEISIVSRYSDKLE